MTIVLEVHDWYTSCGSCGYGSGGVGCSPALELGSLRATSERLGLHPSAISCYARGLGTNKQPKPTIQRATVERVLEHDGLTLEDLYTPESEREPIAA